MPNDGADPTQPTFESYTQEHVQRIIDQMIQTDLELIEAQATLEARLGENQADGISKSTDALNEVKIRVAALIKTKEKQAKLYERLKIAKKPVNSDNYDANLLDYEVSSLLPKREQIRTSLQQLNFEAKRDFFRVILVDEASVPKVPANNKREKYLAAAPVGILFLVIGLFLVLEIKAGRQTRDFATARRQAEARDAPEGEYVGFKP